MTLKLISRKDAKAAGLTQYFTGKPCPLGHIEPRIVSNYWCIKCRCLAAKKWYNSTPENKRSYNQYQHKWRRATPERRKKDNRYNHERNTSTVEGRLVRQLRSRLSKAIRSNACAGSAVRDLGCSIAEFRIYITKKFKEGMSWENWGEWHLDHIQPLALFDLTNHEQVAIACHFSNFQPLWKQDNWEKGAQIIVKSSA